MTIHGSAADEPGRDAGFDERARQAHRQALRSLPPQVRASLSATRRQALQHPARRRLPRWLPGGAAAVVVLSLALSGWLQGHDPDPPPTTLTRASGPPPAAEVTDPEVAELLESLEHNPDFYMWLAANDDALPPPER